MIWVSASKATVFTHDNGIHAIFFSLSDFRWKYIYRSIRLVCDAKPVVSSLNTFFFFSAIKCEIPVKYTKCTICDDRLLPCCLLWLAFLPPWEMFYFLCLCSCLVENATANVTWCIIIDWYAVQLIKRPSLWLPEWMLCDWNEPCYNGMLDVSSAHSVYWFRRAKETRNTREFERESTKKE